ncbi:MAG: hypothetical protein LBQ93_11810 [Treponema sp.]|jgi:hypothetical protein|nr:hypothetical protein [Treponema sp.]
MKKKIIILVVLISLGGSGLFAQISKGASIGVDIACIVVGGGMAAVPLFVSDLNEPPYNFIMYGLGGGIVLVGIISLIYDISTSSSNYYAMEKSPILEHVALNVSRKTVYVGGIWRF